VLSFNDTPYTLPLLIGTGLAWGLSFAIWRRRPAQGANAFTLLMLVTGGWSFFYALEIAAPSLDAKLLLAGVQYIGITTLPVFWLIFLLEYTGREKWLTRRNVILLFVLPTITTVLALTNTQHTLIYTGVSLVPYDGFMMLVATRGGWFWVHTAYSYLLLVSATVLLLRTFLISPQTYKGQIVIMAFGTLTPWVANALYLSGLSPFPGLDLTPFAFAISGAAFAWSMMRFRMLDLVPVARDRVIEGLTDAVFVLDAQGRIADANPAALALLGIPLKTALGQPLSAVLANQTDLIELVQGVSEGSGEVTLNKRVYRAGISELRRRDGQLTGKIVTLHDVSDLKKINQTLADARAQALEASRLKSEFLATMSHELRTPLNAIIGYSDLMGAGIAGDLTELQADYAHRILTNGERLLALINDILDISKIESGRLEIIYDAYGPSDLLDTVKVRLNSLAEKKGITLTTELDPALPTYIMGDLKRLEQILVNLIGNAIRFTSVGGVHVSISAAPNSRYTLTVSDTGEGIPPHAIEYIFEEFRQVDGSAKRQHGGTGLGLAIVRKLATLMNGTVAVRSEVGVGSVFRVTLPLMIADPQSILHSAYLLRERA
jgi:signal transduction histidine kinase